MKRPPAAAFTLIELLVVIAIIAILAVVVVLTLNPAQLLAQSRDANRVSDMATLSSAISLYQTDVSTGSLGSNATIYSSLPDNGSASSTCGDLGLLTLPSGYSYHCATSANLRLASSSGWIPVNFQNISSGSPFGSLPIDPTNSSSSRLYYTYTTNGSQYEVTAAMESTKYQAGGSSDEITGDGAPLATVYAKGTNLTLEPLDYGDSALIGYWPLNEGTGTVAYDDSGNNATGTWQGSASGTNGYYSQGKNQAWAASFNGGNDYIVTSISPAGLPIGASPRTMTAWIYPTNYSTDHNDVVAYGGNWTYALSSLEMASYTGGQLEFGEYSSDCVASTIPPLNQWTFISATYDGSNNKVYANGVLVKTCSAVTRVTPSSTVYIGTRIGQSEPFSGLIQNVRIYTKALTDTQISGLYSGGK